MFNILHYTNVKMFCMCCIPLKLAVCKESVIVTSATSGFKPMFIRGSAPHIGSHASCTVPIISNVCNVPWPIIC